MFEKEAEEYVINRTYPRFDNNQISDFVLREVRSAYLNGAKDGFNKAVGEWHDLRKGSQDDPKKDKLFLVVTKDNEFVIAHWNGLHWAKYNTSDSVECVEDVIACKVIVPPTEFAELVK